MKVGVFLGSQTPEVGGGFTFQDDVLQALIRLESKHTFVIFSYSARGPINQVVSEHLRFVSLRRNFWKLAISNLPAITARVINKVPMVRNWLVITYIPSFKRIIMDNGIDVAWFVSPGYGEVDVPYICTVWDSQHRLQPWFPEVSAKGEWKRREKLYEAAIKRASAIIIGTESGKAEIVQFYAVPPERVRLIPHPTPRYALTAPDSSGKEVLVKYHLEEGYLFYPAQFWPHKNHVGLLLAVRLLRDEYNLILPVVFVGSDQGNLKYVRRVVNELGLSTQVYFLGFVPREDMIGLYRNAFALTYVTFFGPENLPPLEAFALGCPVIASKVSGAEEQLGDAALLVDPKDEKQIADAIKQLHDDPTLRDILVSRGKARASKWTSNEYVKAVLSIFDEFEPIRRCWGR